MIGLRATLSGRRPIGLGVVTLLEVPLPVARLAEERRQVDGSNSEAVADNLVEVWGFAGVKLMKGSLSRTTELIESMEAMR